jgi:hypothetical protein
MLILLRCTSQRYCYCVLLHIYAHHIYLSIYLRLYSPLLDLGRFFSSLVFYTVVRTPWTGDQSIARPLPAHRTAQTQNKRTQSSMPRVGFELTIPVFERAKTVHALESAATVVVCAPCSTFYFFYTSFRHFERCFKQNL